MSSIWVVSSPPRWFMNPAASDTRRVPPYRPTPSESISCTTGSIGMRSSTGGSSPAATRAASIGASLNRPLIAAPAPAPADALCSASPVANASAGAISSAQAASHRHVIPIFAMETL